MSRESKIFSEPKALINKRVREYESFGWELLSINGTDVSMSRETQNKVYVELVKYEYEYEALREKLSYMRPPVAPSRPRQFDYKLCLILLLIFILPGAGYITYKVIEYNKYKESMELHNQAMASFKADYQVLEQEIKRLCEHSRAVFFSKQ